MRQIREHRQQRNDIILEPTKDPVETLMLDDQEEVVNYLTDIEINCDKTISQVEKISEVLRKE